MDKWKNTWVMGGWDTNDTSLETWAAFTLGAFLATSQPACPDNLSDLTQLTFPSKLLIIFLLILLMRTQRPKEVYRFVQRHKVCQVSLAPKSVPLQDISAASGGSC